LFHGALSLLTGKTIRYFTCAGGISGGMPRWRARDLKPTVHETMSTTFTDSE